MRVVITGGSGLIGRALTDSLTADGIDVVVLSRNPTKVSGLPKGARAAGWDGESADGWSDLLTDHTAIVHLAGANIAEGRWSDARKGAIRRSRVDSGAAVVAAIDRAAERSAAPPVLLQASAVGYYGPSGAREVTEDDAPGEDFLASVCEAWEASTAAVDERGVRRVVLRTGVVLAKNGGALPQMARPFRLFAGGPVGDGRQYLPWIHIADQVRAMRFLLDSDSARGPYNITAPTPVTNAALAEALGRVLHRPSFLPAPAFALKAVLGEMAQILLSGQNAPPRRLLEAGFEFRFPRLRDALEDLLG